MTMLVLAHEHERKSTGVRRQFENHPHAGDSPFLVAGSRRMRTFLSLVLSQSPPRILARILGDMRYG